MSFSWVSFRAAGRRLSAVRYPPRLELMPGRRDHHVYCGLHAGACILMDCDCHKLWPSLRFKTGHAAHGGCDYQENVCGYNNILGDVHGTFVIVCRREPCIAQPSHCSIMFGDCHSVVRGDFPMAASAANSPFAPLGQIVQWTAKPSPFSIQGRHGLSEFFWITAAKTLKNPYRLQTVTLSQRHVHLHSQAWTWVNANSNLRDNASWKWFKFKARWRLAHLFLASIGKECPAHYLVLTVPM